MRTAFPGLSRAATVVILGVATIGVGCTTLDPYTGEEERSKAGTGAAIGALAGVIVGAATGDDAKERRKRALIGAGTGALAGGSVGYYMDVQERKLRDELQGTGVSVSREGDNIVLNMPGNITFQTDSSDLNPDFFEVLDAVSKVVEEYEKTLVVVTGHTDSTGGDTYNQQLSERRAASVGQYLRKEGVSMDRMVIIGYGESRPVASNETPEGRAQNRRVELTLEPLTRE
ncbi:MAG: OmpA family protein [Proteobacteria bacterium]|nr:OmpA family protein [Pseudomonadota bacterium]